MTRHIFKLVWNRKRSTGLIFLEILICFLVLCGVLSAAMSYLVQWREPLGFEYEDVWVTRIGGVNFYSSTDEEKSSIRQGFSALLRDVQNMPEVEEAALSFNIPYSGNSWIDDTWINGKNERVYYTQLSPELTGVLKLGLLSGRWVENTDAALSYRPVVITRNLARGLFGDENPIGRDMPQFNEEGQLEKSAEDDDIYRVVGVLADYRRNGELRTTPFSMFVAVDFENGEDIPQEMLIRVRPGTTAEFEEKLVKTMLSVSPQWSYDTRLLEQNRKSNHLSRLAPLLIATVVAAFLIIMVGLGLVGVLWQSIARRTAELGLRRALGASSFEVRRQVLGELLALTTIAALLGSILFLQLPLLGANFGAGWPVFLGGTFLAALLIFAFVAFCGLYPTWLATRVEPALALQYE